jgi:peptidoglycan pentaglycine glycine transferase (the first glycine)
MAVVSLAEWRAFLQSHPDAHILQTAEWGELKAAFGWRPVRIVSGGFGAQLLFRELPLGLTIGYLPKPVFTTFTAGTDQALKPDESFWEELDSVCRQQRAILLKLEPDSWGTPLPDAGPDSDLSDRRFRISPHNIQPPRTIVVDLRGNEEDILTRMKQKCRYNIRLAERKGVKIRSWNDLEAFHRMVVETGGRDGFGVHSLEYYRRAYDLFHPSGLAELLVAEYDSRPLAALMAFVHGRRAWYLFGASSGHERNLMPTYLLQWEAMRWARSHDSAEYDLWGVPDEDEAALEAGFEARTDGLWGVYRFKRGFGGRVLRASQARDRVYNHLLYRAYLWRYAGLRE